LDDTFSETASDFSLLGEQRLLIALLNIKT